MQSRAKKITFVAVLLIGALFFGFNYFSQNLSAPKQVKAQASSDPLKGWAWSSNIGWVKFDGWSNSVELLASNKFKGYAWSSNIGWIDFAPSQADINAATNLTAPTKPPEIDSTTNSVSGYARALSYGGGWDGWIKMSGSWTDDALTPLYEGGVRLNSISNKLEGFSWGGDVIGWLNFGDPLYSNYGVTLNIGGAGSASCNFSTIYPIVGQTYIKPSQSATLSWTCNNVNTCSIKNDLDNSAVCGNCGDSGNQSVSPVKTTSYTLSCTNAGGPPISVSTTVNVGFTPTRCEINPRTGVLQCP